MIMNAGPGVQGWFAEEYMGLPLSTVTNMPTASLISSDRVTGGDLQ